MDIITGKKHFNNIVTGFAFHLAGQLFGQFFDADIPIVLFGTIGWFFIIRGLSNLKSVMRNPFHGMHRVLYVLYYFVCAVMIVRGYFIDYEYQWLNFKGMINAHLFAPTYILCYFMPIVALIPANYYSFDKIVQYSIIGSIFFVLFVTININTILQESLVAAITGVFEEESGVLIILELGVIFAFVILCKSYIKPKTWYINALSLFVALGITVLCARRGGVVIILLIFLIYFWLNLQSKKTFFSKFGVLLIVLLISVVFISMFSDSSVFGYLRERGVEDSRSHIDQAIMEQLSPWEKIFGRGLNGRYYFYLPQEADYRDGWRYGTETGFFNIVLKGGFLMAFTYILVLLIPALKGVFKSNNLLCKAGGAYILLSLFELYPHGWLTFNIKFLIIWMCVAICSSAAIRRKSDKDIYYEYFSHH